MESQSSAQGRPTLYRSWMTYLKEGCETLFSSNVHVPQTQNARQLGMLTASWIHHAGWPPSVSEVGR